MSDTLRKTDIKFIAKLLGLLTIIVFVISLVVIAVIKQPNSRNVSQDDNKSLQILEREKLDKAKADMADAEEEQSDETLNNNTQTRETVKPEEKQESTGSNNDSEKSEEYIDVSCGDYDMYKANGTTYCTYTFYIERAPLSVPHYVYESGQSDFASLEKYTNVWISCETKTACDGDATGKAEEMESPIDYYIDVKQPTNMTVTFPAITKDDNGVYVFESLLAPDDVNYDEYGDDPVVYGVWVSYKKSS